MTLIDFILIAFSIGIIIFIRRPNENRVIFSENDTTPLRGIMCVLIILHHFSEKNIGGLLFPYLQHFGYLLVGVFFFLSGFGVMSSYIKQGKNYFKGFLATKPLYLLVVYLLFCIPYTIIKLLFGLNVSFLSFLYTFINGQPYVTFGWYIFVQIIYYLLFYAVFRFADNKTISIILLCLLGIAITILFQILHFDSYWYISNLSFPIGVILASYKEKIESFIKNNYLITIILTSICFIGFSYAYKLYDNQFFYSVTKNIATILFSIIIFCIFFVIIIKSKIWYFLGKISLEIYLWHGFFMTLYGYCFKEYPFAWLLATIVSTVALSFISNLFNKKIKNILRIISS